MDLGKIRDIKLHTERSVIPLALSVKFEFKYGRSRYHISSVHTSRRVHGIVAGITTSRTKNPINMELYKAKIYEYLLEDPQFGFDAAYTNYEAILADERDIMNRLAHIEDLRVGVNKSGSGHEAAFEFEYGDRQYAIMAYWDNQGYIGCGSLYCGQQGQFGYEVGTVPLEPATCEALVEHLKTQSSTRLELVTQGLT